MANTDKSLYAAPTGIEELAQDEAPIEIEIIDPEAVNIHADGLDIEIKPGEPSIEDFDANLADYLEEGVLQSLGGDLTRQIEDDKASRKEWEKAYVMGLKLLGLQIEERTEPWQGACGVFHPMIAEAVVRFQSETITETFPASGPVKTKIVGKETPEVKEAAVRVQDDMNFRLTEEMPEYRPEHERMLWSLPATGSAFKKVYYDPSLGRPVSMFIPAEDMILPYGASDLDTCERVTHVMRKTENEIKKLMAAGFYRQIDLPAPDRTQDDIQKAKDKETGFSDLNDDRYILEESHVALVIEADPLAEATENEDGERTSLEIAIPYVVTLLKGTGDVLSIRRNWREDDDLKLKRQHFVHYQYVPGFGAYGFGLFHLIGGYAKSATSIMRQLVDAGTLSNLPGGLKSRGLRIKGDDTPIAPGEWRDVDVGSGAIRDNILPLPYKEPSAVLAGLLDKIVDEGRRFAATADTNVSDMSANAPVGSTLALLERQLKVLTAVQARVHNALKSELKLLKAVIRDFTAPEYNYDPEYGTPRAKQADYDKVDVIPVSDPNAATLSQRVVQYQAVIQMAQMAPDIYDLPQLHRGMLEVLGIKHPEKLVPLPEDMKPTDPVTENQNLLKSEPVKAFLYQDHQSHIQVHMSMMQDPTVMAVIGQSPLFPKFQAALMAHVTEHVGYAYRQQVEQQLGLSLPPDEEELPPQVEQGLSTMMAQAAQQVLLQNQAKAAQAQAQQQAQDPLVQMQMMELQLKKRELDIKEKKLLADAAAESDKLHLEDKKISGQLELESLRVGAQIKESQHKSRAQNELEGLRIGADIAKNKAQMAGNDPRLEAIRAQHSLAADQMRTQHELSAERAKAAMEAQQHQQNLAHKDDIHRQNLKHQRAQAKAQLEMMQKKPKEKPTK